MGSDFVIEIEEQGTSHPDLIIRHKDRYGVNALFLSKASAKELYEKLGAAIGEETRDARKLRHESNSQSR